MGQLKSSYDKLSQVGISQTGKVRNFWTQNLVASILLLRVSNLSIRILIPQFTAHLYLPEMVVTLGGTELVVVMVEVGEE